MGVSQLIPVYVQRYFAQHYYQRKVLTAEELLNALKQHAGYNTAVGQIVRERAATEIRRVAKLQPGSGTGERSCDACQLGPREILLR